MINTEEVQEYFVEDGSHTGHCCFEWSLMAKYKDGAEEVVAEFFTKGDAFLVCDAMNAGKAV